MQCVICKQGDTADGVVTVTLERNKSVVVIKDVPAQVCANCGEYYLSDEVSTKILALADGAVQTGAEVTITAFAA